MAEVRLRSWRREDVEDIAVMAEDPHVRRWSTLADDLERWIDAERRRPDRVVSDRDGQSRMMAVFVLAVPR